MCWKQFKWAWTNYTLATKFNKYEEQVQVVILLAIKAHKVWGAKVDKNPNTILTQNKQGWLHQKNECVLSQIEVLHMFSLKLKFCTCSLSN